MPLTITQRAKARIAAHGLNVYPLEGFGLLLGYEPTDPEEGYVLAALPVGKTERWYEPTGRFFGISEALSVATDLFSVSQLRPIGTYCTAFDSTGTYADALIASAPQVSDAPWLVLRPVDGGETLLACRAKRWQRMEWHDESLVTVSPRVGSPECNPRRIAATWNRAWGVLDYGNRHEIELPRLGLIVHPRHDR